MTNSKKPGRPSNKEKFTEAIHNSQAGAQKAMMDGFKLATGATVLIDKLTSSSLKKVMKLFLFHPFSSEDFEKLSIVPRADLNKTEEELMAVCAAVKDYYSDYMGFKRAELAAKERINQIESKEKKDE